ncbi:MAG TPA: hypothetical protein DCQ80_05060 [Pseudomonas sp.]|nr:hypothetical protein [Pseudomonas sp.]
MPAPPAPEEPAAPAAPLPLPAAPPPAPVPSVPVPMLPVPVPPPVPVSMPVPSMPPAPGTSPAAGAPVAGAPAGGTPVAGSFMSLSPRMLSFCMPRSIGSSRVVPRSVSVFPAASTLADIRPARVNPAICLSCMVVLPFQLAPLVRAAKVREGFMPGISRSFHRRANRWLS